MRPPSQGAARVESVKVSADEERRLFERYGVDRDRAVRNEIVLLYRYVAEYAAQQYHRRDVADDIAQVGLVGLIRAVERFDPNVGVRFSTFAERSINGWMKRYFRDHGWGIRPPRRIQEAYLEVNAAREELTQGLGRPPTPDELAREVERSVDEILEALDAESVRRPASIDAREGAIGVVPARPDDAYDQAEARLLVSELCAGLPARDREIIVRRFYDGETEAALAARFGVSQSYMSRILKRTLAKLRQDSERADRLPARAGEP
jgi:RNA polymerase sigma-B factor